MPFERDLLTAMAVAFREVDGIEIGTGVLPIQNQHPMLLAQRALTLNVIAGGRLVLGLGMTHQAVTEGMWGIPWDKPIRRLGEFLDGLLPLLDGEQADAVGETVTTRGALQIPGAHRTRCLHRRAGPADAQTGRAPRRRNPHLDDGAQDTGRTCRSRAAGRRRRGGPAGRERSGWRRRCRSASPTTSTAARKVAAEQFAMYGYLPSYRAMLDREGYAGPEDAALIGDEDEVSGAHRRTARGRRRRVRRGYVRPVGRRARPHPGTAAQLGS